MRNIVLLKIAGKYHEVTEAGYKSAKAVYDGMKATVASPEEIAAHYGTELPAEVVKPKKARKSRKQKKESEEE